MNLRTVFLAGTPALKQPGSELGLHGLHGHSGSFLVRENEPNAKHADRKWTVVLTSAALERDSSVLFSQTLQTILMWVLFRDRPWRAWQASLTDSLDKNSKLFKLSLSTCFLLNDTAFSSVTHTHNVVSEDKETWRCVRFTFIYNPQVHVLKWRHLPRLFKPILGVFDTHASQPVEQRMFSLALLKYSI